jgi:hypothetical protein
MPGGRFTLFPHDRQKRAGLSGAEAAPQNGQNFAWGGDSAPQFTHFTMISSNLSPAAQTRGRRNRQILGRRRFATAPFPSDETDIWQALPSMRKSAARIH